MPEKRSDKITYLEPLGRFLLSLLFIVSGISKITNWTQVSALMADKGIIGIPFFLGVSSVVELVAGLALLFGNRTRLAAGVLLLYLIPVTLVFHNFWALAGPDQTLQGVMFLKNLAIMGGLLEAVAHGASAYSVDGMRARMGTEATLQGTKRAEKPPKAA